MREWLINLRKKRGLSQNEVAKAANISRSYIAKIESGSSRPSADVAMAIAEKLDFNWTLFFASHCDSPSQSEIEQAASTA